MDREEYRLRTGEIKALVRDRRYPEAAAVADSIDWKRVKSVRMLCTVGDVYKITGRFQKSRNAMLLAYDRDPMNPEIVYSLCELAIKLGDFIGAIEYLKEYIRLAPGSTGRYVLQYKIYEEQGVSAEERAELLEELKTQEYKPRWVYELALMYRQMGDELHCAATCDDIFERLSMQHNRSSHRYVIKALKLKSEGTPLTEAQAAYLHAWEAAERANAQEEEAAAEEAPRRRQERAEGARLGKERPERDRGDRDSAVKRRPDGARKRRREASEELPSDAATAIYPPVGTQMSYPEPETMPAETVVYEPVTNALYNEPGIAAPTQTFAPVRYEPTNLQDEIARGVQDVIPEEEVPVSALKRPQGAGRMIAVEEDDRFHTVLSQENDGQISLVLPEAPEVERQITGQISIEDIMNRIRSEQREAQEVRVKQIVQGRTEGMFNSFERSAKEGPQVEIDAMLGIDREAEEEERKRREEAQQAQASGKEEKPGKVRLVTPRPAVAGVVKPDRPAPEKIRTDLPEVPDGDTTEFPAATNALEALMMRKAREEQKTAEENKASAEKEAAVSIETASASEGAAEAVKAAATGIAAGVAAGAAGVKLAVKETGIPAKPRVPEYLRAKKEEEKKEEKKEEVEEEKTEETKEEKAEEKKEEVKEEKKEEEKKEEEKEEEKKEEKEEPVKEEQKEETPEEDKKKEEEVKEETKEEKKEEEKKEDVKKEKKEEPVKKEQKEEKPETDKEKAEDKKEEDKPEEKKDTAPLTDEQVAERIVALSDAEKNLYGHVLHNREVCKQIVSATDTLAVRKKEGAYVTGKDGDETLNIAKGLIRSATKDYKSFSGKVAKIKGESLTAEKTPEFFSQLRHGALIVTAASKMDKEAQEALVQAMEDNARFTMVVLTDTDKNMRNLLNENAPLAALLTAQVDVENVADDSLVAYGREYAREKEYAIDNLGILALHTRIESLQTYDHKVTKEEVKEIVDEAIGHASKRNFAHFVDVLTHKRYDEEDMIILREKDFGIDKG